MHGNHKSLRGLLTSDKTVGASTGSLYASCLWRYWVFSLEKIAIAWPAGIQRLRNNVGMRETDSNQLSLVNWSLSSFQEIARPDWRFFSSSQDFCQQNSSSGIKTVKIVCWLADSIERALSGNAVCFVEQRSCYFWYCLSAISSASEAQSGKKEREATIRDFCGASSSSSGQS